MNRMIRKECAVWAIRWLLMLSTVTAQAARVDCLKEDLTQQEYDGWRLQTHEANRLGYTFDDSGQFMDFVLSVKFTALESCMRQWITKDFSTLITFTGRFGQYFERDSSPVIGKRFNPEWVMAHYDYNKGKHGYLEFGYAHESNGQRVSDLASYQQAQATLEKPAYADDYISRGWDFFHIVVASPVYQSFGLDPGLQFRFNGKWFQKHGVFEGAPEEYNAWEQDPEGKPRKKVDGLTFDARTRWKTGRPVFTELRATLALTTGYKEIFRYNTIRAELGTRIIDIPVVVWWSNGYNQDLVRYYNRTISSGIAVVMENF